MAIFQKHAIPFILSWGKGTEFVQLCSNKFKIRHLKKFANCQISPLNSLLTHSLNMQRFLHTKTFGVKSRPKAGRDLTFKKK